MWWKQRTSGQLKYGKINTINFIRQHLSLDESGQSTQKTRGKLSRIVHHSARINKYFWKGFKIVWSHRIKNWVVRESRSAENGIAKNIKQSSWLLSIWTYVDGRRTTRIYYYVLALANLQNIWWNGILMLSHPVYIISLINFMDFLFLTNRIKLLIDLKLKVDTKIHQV